MQVQYWPTRYKCRKCTRSLSHYPWGCTNAQCPVKKDALQDIVWNLYVVFWMIVIGFFVITYLVNTK